uniref:Uncharacterized protein n=1 Tax=Arundo donax TaxID=35708 RepID=A0A0A9GRN3_ARUDO
MLCARMKCLNACVKCIILVLVWLQF